MSATRETVWKNPDNWGWADDFIFTEKTVMQDLAEILKVGKREGKMTIDELDALLDRGIYAPLHNVCVFEHTIYFNGDGSLTRYVDFYDVDGNFLGQKRKIWKTRPIDRTPFF